MNDTTNSPVPIRPEEIGEPSRELYDEAIRAINRHLQNNALMLANGHSVEYHFDFNKINMGQTWEYWGAEIIVAYKAAGWVVNQEYKGTDVYPGWGTHLYFKKPTP